MKAQMIRVISSPSSSTTGFLTWILSATGGGDAIDASLRAERRRAAWPEAGAPARMESMATVERRSAATHEVFNQPPPLAGYNVFEADEPLREAVRREGADWAEARISAVGELAGSERMQQLGVQANENPPKLRTHDRYGNRVDEVEFHPAWHELLGAAVEQELHSLPWKDP